MARKDELVELRELDIPGLLTALAEATDDAFKLRFKSVTGQLENTSALVDSRRRIARINTLLREREIAAAEQASTGSK
jgi:large subunit ribosomal protein L29